MSAKYLGLFIPVELFLFTHLNGQWTVYFFRSFDLCFHSALATRPIKKGEEIHDAYSGVFSKAEAGERVRDHARYHFECRCVACAEEWPTLSSGAIESRVAKLGAEAYRAAAAGQVDAKKLKRFSRLADKALRPTQVGLMCVPTRENCPLTCGKTCSAFLPI